MKKVLLFATAMVFAVSGANAQSSALDRAKVKQPGTTLHSLRCTVYDATAKQPRRSYSSGVYATRPEGAFYRGLTYDGYGTILTNLVTPMGTEAVFKNSLPSAAKWTLFGGDVTTTKESGAPYYLSGNDYVFAPGFSTVYYGPMLVNGTDSAGIGSNNLYTQGVLAGDSRFNTYSEYLTQLQYGTVGVDSIDILYPVDDHSAFWYNNTVYSNDASLGFLSTNYMYGTGTFTTTSGTTYTSYMIDQYIGKATSPLYVEQILAQGDSHTKPLTGSATLTAYICGVQEEQNEDGTTAKVPDLENILATFTATAEDATDFESNWSYGGETFYQGQLAFSNKVEDDFGNLVNEPYVIPAGTEFAIVVYGFNEPNVDFGINGLRMTDEEAQSVPNGNIYLVDDNNNTGSLTFQANIAAKIALVGMYDKVLAPEQPGWYNFEDSSVKYNVVRVTGSGSSTVNVTDGTTSAFDSEDGTGYPGAVVFTAIPFFDEEENPNYEVIDAPDWITGTNVASISGQYNDYVISFEVDELPTGVTGRAARVYVQGKGVTSEPIIVLQGDATVTDGINAVEISNNNVKISGETYNVNGQKVGKSYKGLVINNGKKFIQK